MSSENTTFLNIELREIDSVKPYERNPRLNDKAVDAVAASLKEFGFRQPIVVDSDGIIVVGHTRYRAALKLGLQKIPVHVATDLTPEQIRAYRIADNKTAELSEWDFDILPIELSELKDTGFDMELLAFGDKELTKLLNMNIEQGLTDPDEVPEPPDEPVTQRGDVWILANRQKGQKYLGEPTRIEWSADKVVLPTIAGSNASGVVISCSGMHGSDIRGQQHARPDGKVERPGLVLIDDPQTTESAWSRSQSQRREAILAGDVLGMAGPGKKIAGLMACTVIRPGDMASRILDREKHPEWQGERTKLVYCFPTNEKLWAKYSELRNDSLRNDGDRSVATEFYRSHRHEMDAGSMVAWPERFNSDELSAIQNAMNLKLRDELAFYAEYQNEPKVEDLGEEMLTIDDIAEKTNGYQRAVIPSSCQHLTMFTDVHQNALFWMLAAWEPNFTGFIVDYGTWPDQHREYFTLRDCQKTIKHATGGAGLEAAIYTALTKVAKECLDRVYFRDDGAEMRVERVLIDAGWGQTSDVIYQYCRQSKQAAILFPSHGQYVGASSLPFSEHKKNRGDRVGRHWRIPGSTGNRMFRHVMIDTNFWKTFVHARLAILMGDPGCLSLFGHDSKRHRLLAEHLTAEYRVRTMAYSRTVDEWKVRVSRPDNHWLDCLVGCAVAASIQGAELTTFQSQLAARRERIKLSSLQAQRRGHR